VDWIRAQANCLSLTWMLSRAMALSISTSASVATWWPRPLLPEWIMTQTWPFWSMPIFLATNSS